jgi:hypothetical protein
MSDVPKIGEDGLAGKARQLVEGARDYARPEETRAKLAEARKKAVEVAGAGNCPKGSRRLSGSSVPGTPRRKA